jgi:hypothetical protein
LLTHIGKEGVEPELDAEVISQPARYSEGSSLDAIRSSGDRNWLEEVTSEQIRCGSEILARFGLGELFDKGSAASDFEDIAASLWRRTDGTTNY